MATPKKTAPKTGGPLKTTPGGTGQKVGITDPNGGGNGTGAGGPLNYNFDASKLGLSANAPKWDNSGSNGLYKNISDQATNGVTNSFNTSANRLRERLSAATQGQAQSQQNADLSRGFGNSGIASANQQRIQSSGQQNYAQGLDTLSNQFEQNRLQGLGIANQSANGLSQNENAQGGSLYNLVNNREQRQSNQFNNNTNNQTNRDISYYDRLSREKLSQQQDDTSRWSTAVGLGNNKLPTQGAYPGGGGAAGGGISNGGLGQSSSNSQNFYNILNPVNGTGNQNGSLY